MRPTRREALQGLAFGALASGSLAVASSCSTFSPPKSIARIAMLSPISGERATSGKSIAQAIGLISAPGIKLQIFDTQGNAEGAASAATAAAAFNPSIIIGPASAEEASAVKALVPVLTLSNDETLQALGLHVLGVTAAQSTAAVLGYARRAGVRSIGIVGGRSEWSARCENVARNAGALIGVQLVAAVDSGAAAEEVIAGLRAAGGGELPNAVFFPEGGAALSRIAPILTAAGVQLLGSTQWSASDLALPSVQGAWVSAPDPAAAARFSEAYTRAYAQTPTMLAGLAYDAMLIAKTLASAEVTSDALTREEGFNGVTGAIRFPAGKPSERRLSILVASPGGARVATNEALPWA